MDEAWERAVEAARGGEDPSSVRSLTLDGAVKCSQGRLPSASLLEQFSQLRILSIANVGLTSLAEFPCLRYLGRLILSDNRIAGGLEYLVQAGLSSLQDLDLSNNKIQLLEDLAPLASLNLLSLDLYECPVTRLPEYRAKVFGMIKSLQYLDKIDAENNERPETDEEEDEEEEEEDVDDELADGIEGEGDEDDTLKFDGRQINSTGVEVDDDLDEEDDKDDDGEESDELDEDDDGARYAAASRVNHLNQGNEDSGSDEEEVDDDDEDDTENVEVHDVVESEEEEGDEDDEDGGEDEEEEEEEEGTEQVSGPLLSTEGEIDAQDNEDEDENGELGDEEDADGVDDDLEDEDEEGDYGTEYLVQPIGQVEDEEAASDFEPGEDDDDDEDVDDDEDEDSTPSLKRKRGKDEDDSSDKDERPPKH